MSLRSDLMSKENERLLEIYRAHPEMNMLEVIDKYASDEFKTMLEDDQEDIEVY